MTYFDAASPRVESSTRRRIPRLTWRRLPWWAELLVIGLGYFAYTRGRLAAPAKAHDAFFHSSQVWDLERLLHIDIEPVLNRMTAAWSFVGESVGYYYGTLHFVVTPAVLIWLWLRRPDAYARLRSALVVATLASLVVFWLWPLAPPRFALPGAVDIVTRYDIFGAAHPHGVSSMVNLYAAMPSLHVGWATWCAFAVFATTTGRWRKLVWIYPALTTFVVLGSANHYLLDAVGGVAVVALGLYLTRGDKPLDEDPTLPGLVHEAAAAAAPPAPVRDTNDAKGLGAGLEASEQEIIDLRRAPASRPTADG